MNDRIDDTPSGEDSPFSAFAPLVVRDDSTTSGADDGYPPRLSGEAGWTGAFNHRYRAILDVDRQALDPIGSRRDAQSEKEFRQALKANEREARALAIHYDAARDEALQANLARTAGLWRMSHGLRTPLHSVPGFAQVREMGNFDDDQLGAV